MADLLAVLKVCPEADAPKTQTRTSHAELCGTWVKDGHVSDPLNEAMDALHLGMLVRQAIKLIKGAKIEVNEEGTVWSFAVFSIIEWFKVSEHYSLAGEPAQFNRRDMRKGKHTGQLLPVPGPHGGLMLSLKWDGPYGGTGTDEFVLAPRGTAAREKSNNSGNNSPTNAAAKAAGVTLADGTLTDLAIKEAGGASKGDEEVELHVYSTVHVGGKTVRYRMVYWRRG